MALTACAGKAGWDPGEKAGSVVRAGATEDIGVCVRVWGSVERQRDLQRWQRAKGERRRSPSTRRFPPGTKEGGRAQTIPEESEPSEIKTGGETREGPSDPAHLRWGPVPSPGDRLDELATVWTIPEGQRSRTGMARLRAQASEAKKKRAPFPPWLRYSPGRRVLLLVVLSLSSFFSSKPGELAAPGDGCSSALGAWRFPILSFLTLFGPLRRAGSGHLVLKASFGSHRQRTVCVREQGKQSWRKQVDRLGWMELPVGCIWGGKRG